MFVSPSGEQEPCLILLTSLSQRLAHGNIPSISELLGRWTDEWSVLSFLQELIAYYRELSIAQCGKIGLGQNYKQLLVLPWQSSG